jgi:hypothetical protein
MLNVPPKSVIRIPKISFLYIGYLAIERVLNHFRIFESLIRIAKI